MVMLPQQFLERMERILGAEYEDFLASYHRDWQGALRINSLKGSVRELAGKLWFLAGPVPWAPGGFYYKEGEHPGRHPFHAAGVYYIQEASAMAPAVYLKAQPGERILDLCAAPGGKSTQIAADMEGKGLLILNELHPKRAEILSENTERLGVKNALVVSHEPAYLARRFPGFFDRILVDAPCSGEGMFRRNEDAIDQWSPENVEMCAERQDEILDSAAVMLRPGGRMIYSTCTFEPSEDEGSVRRFLARHPEFYLEELERFPGMSSGLSCLGAERAIRIWPHRAMGEGHFFASMVREGRLLKTQTGPVFREKGISLKECGEWQEFRSRCLKAEPEGIYLRFGDQLYLAPEQTPPLKGLRVLRCGLHLGTLKKNRFEPAHALALALTPKEAVFGTELSVKEAERYLRGETFSCVGEKGWYLVNVEGCSLGWGKLSGGIMKNHYPKGLRQ